MSLAIFPKTCKVWLSYSNQNRILTLAKIAFHGRTIVNLCNFFITDPSSFPISLGSSKLRSLKPTGHLEKRFASFFSLRLPSPKV